MKKIIDIDRISVDYDLEDDQAPAINDVSLTIHENEFVCILGPSGCGKSTLLKTIAGFIKPFQGTAKIEGKEIQGPGKDRGVVFQEPNLFPWYNVAQNVSIGPRFAGLPKEETASICHKYLTQVELSEYKDQKVFELSGGQKQRIAIARTLANNPEIILMDEPFGALDSFTRQKMQVMIRNIWHKNNSTIFFVTHDIDEALLLATKIYIMNANQGTIIKDYEVDYTFRLLKDQKQRVYEEKEFIKLKDEIISLLEV